MEIDVRDHTEGPLFNELGPQIVRDYLDATVEEVAQVGKDEVDRVLQVVIRNPTPIYQTKINIRRDFRDRVINDSGIIYGPWLEGVGTKNKTTRFKGYFTFRRVRHWLDQQTPTIANSVLVRYLARLRG